MPITRRLPEQCAHLLQQVAYIMRLGLGAAVAGSQLSGPVSNSHPHNPISLITMAVGVRTFLYIALAEAPKSFNFASATLLRPQWHPHS
jgi:hypothetical protein